jgi:hypothetical protein
VFKQHDHLVGAQAAVTARDTLSISSVLELFPTLPNWPKSALFGHRAGHVHGARTILEWLESHPGRGWQDRWLVSSADRNLDWIDSSDYPAGRADRRAHQPVAVPDLPAQL